MKWIFVILVALNLVVFAASVVQKMVIKEIAGVGESQKPRTVVVREPHPVVPSVPVAPVASAPAPAPVAVADKKPSSENKKPAPREVAKNTAKPVSAPAAPAVRKPRNCGGASVELKENDYHRIKGLLAQWPNAASRNVRQNPKAAAASKEYLVFVPIEGDPQEQMMQLALKSFYPQERDGMIILGKFSQRPPADALRRRVMNSGFRALVLERLGTPEEGLSMAVYHVAFLKVDDNDAKRLSEILKPYAALQRHPCP